MGSWFKRRPTAWERASIFQKAWTAARGIWQSMVLGRFACLPCILTDCRVRDAKHTIVYRLKGWKVENDDAVRSVKTELDWVCDAHLEGKVGEGWERTVQNAILKEEKELLAYLRVEKVMES